VTRYLVCWLIALLTVASAGQVRRVSESWLHKLGRILGVDNSPRSLKAPGGIAAGEIWITSATEAHPRLLAAGGVFRSPVFQPGGKYIYALRQDDLVRVGLADGSVDKARPIPNAIKLIGFDRDHPTQVLIVLSAGSRLVDLFLVSVETGRRKTIAREQSIEDPAVASLVAWERRYDRVYVFAEGRDIKVSGLGPTDRNVSRCEEAWCSQPSLFTGAATGCVHPFP
jgi:hypothetical protein